MLPADVASLEEFERSAPRLGCHVWLARRLLRPFLSDFALNGLLGTHPLFLLGTDGWRSLLGDRAGGRLLDVGAAAGEVTATIAPLFDSVVTTDVSRPMVRRLRRRGWDAHCADIARDELPVNGDFDAVTLLNVLDRSARPAELLAAGVRQCRPGGMVIVAMPLPYDPWRYVGPHALRPRQRLPLSGRSFGEDLDALARTVLPGVGLSVERLVRTPYVSLDRHGNASHRLDCSVVVCTKQHASVEGVGGGSSRPVA